MASGLASVMAIVDCSILAMAWTSHNILLPFLLSDNYNSCYCLFAREWYTTRKLECSQDVSAMTQCRLHLKVEKCLELYLNCMNLAKINFILLSSHGTCISMWPVPTQMVCLLRSSLLSPGCRVMVWACEAEVRWGKQQEAFSLPKHILRKVWS